ncbi:MAG: glycoside hydrolase, partial [Clostridiales bacterium]|nr:glycoside hydrolase [Clostridiales bacterium]
MVLELALESNVAPIMLLSSITEEGNFSTEKASALFGDVVMQNKLIENILQTMDEKNYFGLDLDFEFISPEDADNFLSFIRNVTSKLNANGFSVNVDLAPKTSIDQPGLLYEAHNYAEIGAIANTVLLMTYEWGYVFGPPMAVAPIDQVRRVVEFAVSQINPQKIYMGIPNYGYDWPLPFVQGTTEATTIGNVEAVDIARKYSATILYDELAQTP